MTQDQIGLLASLITAVQPMLLKSTAWPRWLLKAQQATGFECLVSRGLLVKELNISIWADALTVCLYGVDPQQPLTICLTFFPSLTTFRESTTASRSPIPTRTTIPPTSSGASDKPTIGSDPGSQQLPERKNAGEATPPTSAIENPRSSHASITRRKNRRGGIRRDPGGGKLSSNDTPANKNTITSGATLKGPSSRARSLSSNSDGGIYWSLGVLTQALSSGVVRLESATLSEPPNGCMIRLEAQPGGMYRVTD